LKKFIAIPLLLLLAACSGVKSSVTEASSSVTLPTAVSLLSVPMVLNPALLPASPSQESDKTVAGADVNNNGLRDDIEIWIARKYPNSAKARAAAAQLALVLQKKVASKNLTKESAYEIGKEVATAIQCFRNAITDHPALKDLMAVQYNTRARVNAYGDFHSVMGGRAFRMPKGDTCSIPTDQLPN